MDERCLITPNMFGPEENILKNKQRVLKIYSAAKKINFQINKFEVLAVEI